MDTNHSTEFQLVTFREACQLLRISRTSLWRRLKSDPAFPAVYFPGTRSPRLSLSDLKAYCQTQSSDRSSSLELAQECVL